MGLNLYYQLTAHSDLEHTPGTFREQLMLGCAIKALHDYPVIDDSTKINGLKILDAGLAGAGNRLRIVLQPIPHNEAVSYWTAGSHSLRLAAYYQVSVVLLEPEDSMSRVARVLSYGVYTFVGGAPRLDSSQNTLSFKLPEETVSREIELRPAQVPPSNLPTAQVPLSSHLNLLGSGLAANGTSLFLKNIRWEAPKNADKNWETTATNDRVSALVRETIAGESVFPGIYSALVEVTRRRTLPDGSIRDFKHLSNECPFVITPRIKITKPLNVNDEWTIEGYIFKDPSPPSPPPPGAPPAIPAISEVQVYVGVFKLELNKTGSIKAGEFRIVNASELKLRLPTTLDLNQQNHPIRVFVNGAESPPEWIDVT
jgi:hypothetical protein